MLGRRLALGALAAPALPRWVMAQDARPSITVAVQKIAFWCSTV